MKTVIIKIKCFLGFHEWGGLDGNLCEACNKTAKQLGRGFLEYKNSPPIPMPKKLN